MSKHVQLNEEPPSSGHFKIPKETLSNFFDRHDIESKATLTKIKSYGGISGMMDLLKTDIKKGLSTTNASDLITRAEHYDRNDPVLAEQKTLWDLIKEPFEDLMLKVIVVSGIVNLGIGFLKGEWETGWIDGVSVLFAVVIIVSVTASNNYMQQKQFEKLYQESEIYTLQVIRDSSTQFIKNTEILVGDLLKFAIGDILPVDGILVHGTEVLVDESNITGETKEVRKESPSQFEIEVNDCTPYMISGSKIMDGEGYLLVCALGSNSQVGKLKLKLQEESPPTPLQLKLEGLSNFIAKIGITASLITFFALIINAGVDIGLGNFDFVSWKTLDCVLNALITAVVVIVIAVPEGLPLAVTLSLAFSINKMRKENNWVRYLKACETMGGVNNICTDKTGTLTTNKMKTENLYFCSKMLSMEELSDKTHYIAQNLQNLCEAICLNSSSTRKTSPNGKKELIGSKTECSLLEYCDNLGYDFEVIKNPDNVVKVIPFSSKRKKMMTIYKLSGNKYRVYVKGASEVLLGFSNYIIGNNGNLDSLTKAKKEEIMKTVISVYAADALRTITVAYKDISPSNASTNPANMTEEELSRDLTLMAIFGIRDPLRPEIPSAIAKCKSAGILVRMVTGDNSETAVSIAKKSGILDREFDLVKSQAQNEYWVLEGAKFSKLIGGVVEVPSEEDPKVMVKKVGDLDMFKSIIRELRVMSRSAPEDKYALVTGLIQLDNVVAVTGDGTNDAPALKKAHIGFAMDSGSAIAKQAAGIILLDDNFNSIVLACKWGRNIFESIRKFIQFQLTINVVAMSMAIVGAIFLKKSPLQTVQMLWVNLIMDSFAALALATEPPHDKLLERRPYSMKDDIITPSMNRFIIGHSIYQEIVLLLLLFMGPEWLGVPNSAEFEKYSEENFVHLTVFFHTFVMLQLFNSLNGRKLDRKDLNIFSNFCNNPLFFIIIFGVLICQILIVEFGGSFIKCSPLTLEQHAICIVLGMGSLVVGLLIKLVPDSWFEKIHFLKAEDVTVQNMDRALTSKLRKKTSIRTSHNKMNF